MKTQEITLETFHTESPYFEDAVRVYTSTWGYNWEQSYAFFARYTTLPGFIGLVAIVDEEVVGMGFGHEAFTGNWWYDRVTNEIGTARLPIQSWILVELCVLDSHRGFGIGTAIHDALLERQPIAHTILSTEVTNKGARRLYERYNWQYLHYGMTFSEGGKEYVIMGRKADVGGAEE